MKKIKSKSLRRLKINKRGGGGGSEKPQKLISPPPPSIKHPRVCSERPCVICNFVKKKDVSQRFRIVSKSRAWHFLAAIHFNKDDVYQRCVFCKQPGDVFAADVL